MITPHNLSESDFEDLGCKTGGFSGSDISVCVSLEPNEFDLVPNMMFSSLLFGKRPFSNTNPMWHQLITEEKKGGNSFLFS